MVEKIVWRDITFSEGVELEDPTELMEFASYGNVVFEDKGKIEIQFNECSSDIEHTQLNKRVAIPKGCIIERVKFRQVKK